MKVSRRAISRLMAPVSVLGMTLALTLVTGGSAYADSPLYEIQRVPPGFPTLSCLDIKAQDPPGNAQVEEWHCHGGDNQRFHVAPSISRSGLMGDQIFDTSRRNCLTVPSPNESAVGADVRMAPCIGGDNQLWTLVQIATGYLIVQTRSNLCLDARNSSWDDGTHIQQYTCNGTSAQQWRFFT